MTYDEKLDLILGKLNAIQVDVEVLKGATPEKTNVPQLTGGLYQFVRPEVGTPRYGLGIKMTSADVFEAIQRANSCVDYQGNQRRSTDEEEVWNEIELLKTGKFEAVKPYTMLDPEFAGFALLTNLFDVAAADSRTWGVNRSKRESFAGVTVAKFLSDQLNITGTPSGS
jgi:hypothetical protein